MKTNYKNEFENISKHKLNPSNECRVKREEAENKLTSLLMSCGSRISILVTGMRGAGKTTLIDNCVNTYQDKVIERFDNKLSLSRKAGYLVNFSIKIILCALLFSELGRFVHDKSGIFGTLFITWLPLSLVLVFTVVNRKKEIENKKKKTLQGAMFFLELLPPHLLTIFLMHLNQEFHLISTGDQYESIIFYSGFSVLIFINHIFWAFVIEFLFQKFISFYSTFKCRRPLYHLYARYWLPAIVVRCNLGFENIMHSTILRTMIVGLVQEYNDKYFSIRSARYWVNCLFPFFIAIFVTNFFQPNVAEIVSNNSYHAHDMDLFSKAIKNHNLEINELQKHSGEQCILSVENEEIMEGITFSLHEKAIIDSSDSRGDGAVFAVNRVKSKLKNIENFLINNHINDCGSYFPASGPKTPTNEVNKRKDENNPKNKNMLEVCTKHSIKGFEACLEKYIDMINEELSPLETFLLRPFLMGENNVFIPLSNSILKDECDYQNCGYNTLNVLWLTLFGIFLFLSRIITNRLDGTYENFRRLLQLVKRLDPFTEEKNGVRYNFSWLSGVTIAPTDNVDEQTPPLGSDSIEVRFKLLLKRIEHEEMPFSFLPFILHPKHSVTFILDELDKLETNRRAIDTDRRFKDVIRTQEARRELIVESILAEMKDIISSAQARFVVIGGRETQDRWLADQTDRRPLLASIFEHCIYVSGLLNDEEELELPIANFLSYYLSIPYPTDNDNQQLTPIGVSSKNNRKTKQSLIEHTLELYPNIINFLAYRSRGNPKKLVELTATFHSAKNPSDSGNLKFKSIDKMRILLISGLFKKVTNSFSHELHQRDDKVLSALFYLSDFIIKFHQRAFSWNSLEKIDELSDIHRAPDIRKVLEQIVVSYQDLILHKVRNGMYTFRFRSEFLSEIEYISRHSPTEMAAFNFTLDESYSVKSLYLEKLATIDEHSNPQDYISIIISLAELYEFDKQFDSARKEYFKALDSLRSKYKKAKFTKYEITDQFTYLVTNLKIGMTYELSRDFGEALTTFHFCENVAFGIIDRLNEESSFLPRSLTELIQPIFMSAWVLEKMDASVDTSVSHIERAMLNLKKKLGIENIMDDSQWDFVNATSVLKANSLLIFSDMSNKAGDLLFFKGISVDDKKIQAGYQFRSRFHYLNALHYLHCFIHYRKRTAPKKLNVLDEDEITFLSLSAFKPIFNTRLPIFPSQALSNVMLDLAETYLASFTLEEILDIKTHAIKELSKNENNLKIYTDELGSHLKDDDQYKKINKFKDFFLQDDKFEQFKLYLSLSRYASEVIYKDGAIETSSRENVRVVESLLHIALEFCIKIYVDKEYNNEENKEKILGIINIAIIQLNILFRWDEYYAKSIGERAVSRYYLSMIRSAFLTLMIAAHLKFKSDNLSILIANLSKNLYDKNILETHDLKNIGDDLNKELRDKLLRKNSTVILENVMKEAEAFKDVFSFPYFMGLKMDYYLLLFNFLNDLQSDVYTEMSQEVLKKQWERRHKELKNIKNKAKAYDDFLQFPHYKIGICQYLYVEFSWPIVKQIPNKKDKDREIGKLLNIKKGALENFNKSLSLCTLGQEYYRTVMDSYYAYDDFNDRHLHFQFTQTMRFSEFILNMTGRIRRELLQELKDYSKEGNNEGGG